MSFVVERDDEFPTWDEWHEAVTQLVKARMREAEAFLRYKAAKADRTDGQAARMAYIETEGAVDMADGRLTYLKGRLGCR